MNASLRPPSLLPRSERLLCHYFPESVRDYISNPAYLQLSLEEKGLMQVLRHYAWHSGLLPGNTKDLSKLTRIDEDGLQRCLPGVLRSGFFVKIEDGSIYRPELEEAIEHAVEKTKRLRASGRKGGKRSGETRRERAATRKPQAVEQDPGAEIPF